MNEKKNPEQKTFKEPEQLVLPCVEEYMKQNNDDADGYIILNMPRGSGKSTILNELTKELINKGK